MKMSSAEQPGEHNNENLNDSKEYVKRYQTVKDDDMGYPYFPNRKPGQVGDGDSINQWTWTSVKKRYLTRPKDHELCKKNVADCVNSYPKVQIMMRALKAHGCPVNLKRHIHCETCKEGLCGGFDYTTSQVVVCENVVKNREPLCNVLAHELLHAFDHCRAHLDLKNMEHVACTEIRAANLLHCSRRNALQGWVAFPWNYELKHQACVKERAMSSLLLARNVTLEEANTVIDKVFMKCYNDMEPIGRRLNTRGNSVAERALIDGILYGYIDS